MSKRSRQFLAVVAITATAAVAVAGATLRGETREAPTVQEACADAAWPMIPAQCLEGAGERTVRYVTGTEGQNDIAAVTGLQERFTIAFQ